MAKRLINVLKKQITYDKQMKKLVKTQKADYFEATAKAALQEEAYKRFPGCTYEFNSYCHPVDKGSVKTIVCEIYKEEE